MKAQAFDNYSELLRTTLESSSEVIGFVTLGTTANPDFRDEWSDHDFWVITEPGAQDSFLNDLSWLPDADNIALTVYHGPRRRTMLYHDRHKIEFAVFDVAEAREGKVQCYRVLIDRDRIAELIESIHQETLKQADVSQTRPNSIQNLSVLVWSACERQNRGEFLSARQYIDGFAVNQLLNLIGSIETVDERRDELDPRRRLELRSPGLAAEILTVLEQPVPKAALRLLEIAERQLKSKTPTLAWDKVAMVSEWIREIDS